MSSKMVTGFLVILSIVGVFYLDIQSAVLQYVLYAIQIISLFFVGYQTVISYAGMRKRKPVPHSNPEKRFAILVAAHNEEEVIGDIVDNLQKDLDYPKEMYDVYVICDNCTDNTAKIVREHDGKAMERHDPANRGKGYGLEWMFKQLWALEEKGIKYDAVVMVDADNLISENFLQIMNTKIKNGAEVIQAYLDSKNPTDTWITKSYAFAYWSTNRIYQLSREHLGLSAQLGGTGVVVTTKMLKEIGWGSTSLTEDLEFTTRYIMKTGKRAHWAHDAKVYDEKPLGLKASWNQRIRWMQGHADCLVRYAPKTLWTAIRKRSMIAFDSAIYLMQPGRTILALILMGFALLSFLGVWTSVDAISILTKHILFSGWVYISFLLIAYSLPIVAMISEKRFKEIPWFFLSYFFGMTWIPITVIGFIKRKSTVWSHTKHTRSLSLKEVQKREK